MAGAFGIGTLLGGAPAWAQAGAWCDLPDIPDPIGAQQEHGVVAIGSKIYVVGGVEAVPPEQSCFPLFTQFTGLSYCSSRDLDVYDTTTGVWSSAAPMPSPKGDADPGASLIHPGAATVNGKLYVLGGMTRDCPAPSPGCVDFPWHAVGNSYVYDPTTNSWSELAPMPAGTERASAAIAAHDGKIYVAGGAYCHEDTYGLCLSIPNTERNDMLSVYDPATNTWEMLPGLPEGRDHVPGTFYDGKLYLFGGRIDGSLGPGDHQVSDVFAYNTHSRRWRRMPSMPTARSEAWLGVVAGKAYLAGGSANDDVFGSFTSSAHEVYDFTLETWTVLDPMPHPRHGPATGTAVVNGTIYLPGGSTSPTVGVVPTLDTFTPGATSCSYN